MLALFSERPYIGVDIRPALTWSPDVVTARIATGMLSPRGPLKAEFRNGVLVVYPITEPRGQRGVFTRKLTSQTSWKK